jgi:hypothetical protein
MSRITAVIELRFIAYMHIVLTGARGFALLHSDQTGSGAQPASYAMSTRGSLTGGEAAGA